MPTRQKLTELVPEFVKRTFPDNETAAESATALLNGFIAHLPDDRVRKRSDIPGHGMIIFNNGESVLI